MTLAANFDVTPTEGNRPLNVTVTDRSTDAQSWSWDFGDGSPPVNGQGPHTHTYAGSGTYSITLTVRQSTPHPASVTSAPRVVSVFEVSASSAGKWIRLITPDYISGNTYSQDTPDAHGGETHRAGTAIKDHSYLRLGAIPSDDPAQVEFQGNEVRDADRHGWYSYTSGNRLEVTDGNREVWIGGANRFSIGGGDLGVYDAEPIYGLYFRSTDPSDPDAAWRRTEWGRQQSDSYWFGDTESWFSGFNLEGFWGLKASMMLGLDVSLTGAVSLAAVLGAEISFGASISYSETHDVSMKVAKEIRQKAREEIVIKVKSTDSSTSKKAKVIGGALGALAIAGGSISSMEASREQAHKVEEMPSSTSTGWAVGGAATAFGGIALIAAVIAVKAILEKKKSSSTDNAWLTMDKSGEILLGTPDAEIAIAGSEIYLGGEKPGDPGLVVDHQTKSIYTTKASFKTDLNNGTLQVLP